MRRTIRRPALVGLVLAAALAGCSWSPSRDASRPPVGRDLTPRAVESISTPSPPRAIVGSRPAPIPTPPTPQAHAASLLPCSPTPTPEPVQAYPGSQLPAFMPRPPPPT